MPFFLLLLVALAFPGAARLSFGTYLKGRVQRLLIPWLVWSAVYATLKLAGAEVALLILRQGVTLPAPLAQWLYALPTVCLGFALALVWGRLDSMLLIFGGFAVVALLSGAHMGLLQIVLAGSALILCVLCPLAATRHAQMVGTLFLGVYLVHPLVLSMLTRATAIPEGSLAMALLTCAGTLRIAWGVHGIVDLQRRPKMAISASNP